MLPIIPAPSFDELEHQQRELVLLAGNTRDYMSGYQRAADTSDEYRRYTLFIDLLRHVSADNAMDASSDDIRAAASYLVDLEDDGDGDGDNDGDNDGDDNDGDDNDGDSDGDSDGAWIFIHEAFDMDEGEVAFRHVTRYHGEFTARIALLYEVTRLVNVGLYITNATAGSARLVDDDAAVSVRLSVEKQSATR